MAEVIWTEPALTDLNDIAEYIALDNSNAAQKLVSKVFSTIERLENFPKSGKTPTELKKTDYREVIVGPCRIFYQINKNHVYILYVMRGERQLRRFIINEREQKNSIL